MKLDLSFVTRSGLGAVPPLPHYVFMAWNLVKHRDNFTFNRQGLYGTKLSSQQLSAYLK
jgi:hypothetical protein